jgi:hypothetical protein
MVSRKVTSLDDRRFTLDLVDLFLCKEWSELSGLRERVRRAEVRQPASVRMTLRGALSRRRKAVNQF